MSHYGEQERMPWTVPPLFTSSVQVVLLLVTRIAPGPSTIFRVLKTIAASIESLP